METRNTKTVVRERHGFTLIEALVLLFIFATITVTFYAVFSTGTQQIIETKNRLGAIAVANEKMEIVRNLDYDAIGTKKLVSGGTYSYGIPGGEIVEDESIAVNTRTFSVHTFVQYMDDPFDGKVTGTTPTDLIPNDYKRVKIEVSWGAGGDSQTVALVSTFVPKGMEVSSGGGTLSLNVIDNAGAGVSRAEAHITNTSTSPHIDIVTDTDATGNLIFPGAKAGSQSYRIEVSKNGYYGVTTYAPYPTTAYNPIDIHASVVEATFNQKTLVMDKASALSVTTKDAFGADLPNLGFRARGGRKIGDTLAVANIPSEAVYSLDESMSTGGDAKKAFGDQSSGTYSFTLADARYRLLRLSPDGSAQNEFSLANGDAADIEAVIADTDIASVLVVVSDTASGEAVPVAGASVHLSSAVLAYDATLATDRYGQAYFPTSLPALVAGTYDYTVTTEGYEDKTGTIVVTTGLETEPVALTAL